jgi:hypothetical protein
MTRIKKALTACALICISTIVGLLLTEAGYRLLSGYPLLSTANLISQRIDLIRNMTGVMDFDDVVGWRLKANLFQAGVPFTTGELGVRMNANKIVPIQQGSILAVGDSFTAGSGVRDEEAWPARLEVRLEQPVVNGSAGAYGVDQIVLRAHQLLPLVKPETLLIGILSQDSLRNNYSLYGGAYKPHYDIVDDKLVLKDVPVPRIDARPLKLGLLRNIFGRFYIVDNIVSSLNLQNAWTDNRLRYHQIHPDKIGPEISCRLMEQMKKLKHEPPIRVIMIMMYGAAEVEASPAPWFASSVVECAKAQGIEVVDTYEPLHAILKANRNEFVRLWLDEGGQLGHMSPHGNDMIAKWVREKMLADRP